MSGVVIVTGASSGIGRATADVLARHGRTVVGTSRRGSGGDGWTGAAMDVDDDDSVASGVAAITAAHGPVTDLVTCAGWGLAGAVETTSLDDARAQVETLFWGSVRPVVACLPGMRAAGGGHVVLVGSLGGVIGLPFSAYYSAAKFALEGWAEALAYEVRPFGIRVTVVEPGNVATAFTDGRRRVTPEGDPYAAAADAAIGALEAAERSGVPAEHVAEVIDRVLSSRRDRRRVTVGRAGERSGVLLKRLLPHAWFEKAAARSLGV